MRNTISLKPLNKKSFYNKCRVVINDDIETLISYTTKVATYNTKTKQLSLKGYYSPTTARHINNFLVNRVGLKPMSKKEIESFGTQKVKSYEK